jgi:sugar lactone lactonase YvrE
LLPELWSDPGIRMNEGACDPEGRFYAGSMHYDKRPGAAALCRLDADGATSIVLKDVIESNGIEWSPDGACVLSRYCHTHRVGVFGHDPLQGLSNRRPFVDLTADRLRPGRLDGRS